MEEHTLPVLARTQWVALLRSIQKFTCGHHGLQKAEELGGETPPVTGCRGCRRVVGGGKQKKEVLEELKREVLQDRGGEKCGPNDGNEGEVAKVEKQGESQGEGGGELGSWHGVEQSG